MKNLLLSIFISITGLCQLQGSDFKSRLGDPDLADGRILGRIIDADNNQPVEYAAVSVKSLDDPQFITGGLSADGGKFNVDKLKPGNYEVIVSFMGYETLTKTITISQNQKTIDLGEILIKPDSKALQAVEVTAQKQAMMVGIDRKVFDVEKSVITTGGTALDVLRQIPTLQVDIDGNISLRGSDNVTIFMNGKNTGISGQNLTQVLKSMPASSIKSVELITNPSAKYDAAGMSGIVNIITKKNLVAGNFGSATVGIGNNNKYSLNGSYNVSSGKFAASTNLGMNSNQFTNKATNLRDNFNAGQAAFSINNRRAGTVLNDGVNLSGNVDYTFNPKNSLSLTYMTGTGRGFLNELNKYEFLDENRQPYNLYTRTSDNHFVSPSVDLGLTYTKIFDTEKKNELIVSGNYSFNKFHDNQNFIQQQQTLSGEATTEFPYDQHIDQLSLTSNYTGQADYTLATSATGKLEAGVKSNFRKLDNSLLADSLNYGTGGRERNNLISNVFAYEEVINAGYLNYAGSIGKWGYQGGLRAEQTGLRIYQEAVSLTPIKRDYTSIFPSLFVNRKWEKDWETQVSYSRRINRPSSAFLNPFPDYSDPLNIRGGNPYLNPEYVNAFEASLMKYWTGHSLTVTTYYRDIHSVFQRIREVNTEGVSRVTINNFGQSVNMGAEIIARTNITSWWTNTINLNLFRTKLEGQTSVRNYETDAFNWNVRIMSNFRFWKNADLQLSAFYMAPYRIPQGYYYGFSGADLGFKKDLWDGKASLGLNFQDVFNTRKFKVTTSDYNYKGQAEFKRESQWIMVNFTYKFGKPGQGQAPRKGRRGQSGQGSEMNMGM